MWSRCRCCAALHRKGSSSVLFLSTKTWNEVSGKLLEVQVLGSTHVIVRIMGFTGISWNFAGMDKAA